ncbi:beta-ketoacyl-ACP synthase 3 [Nibricoccus sp. IMCC34717]|uniref:beta-ketoacyl-ACP synthase 3 n=1 Tax=Nibricoccus sp. IMCC34717 TaxID=3034021 RepID=UPI00384FA58A
MEKFLIDVPVPSMGATVSELTVIDIAVAAGAQVGKGQKLAELESDKSVFEFESPCDGTIVEVVGRAGDILQSGAPFLRIETADASLAHLKSSGSGPATAPAAPAKASPAPLATPVATPLPVSAKAAAPAPTPAASSGLQWTPRALKLAQDSGLNPLSVPGIEATGPGGRVSGDDVARYLERRQQAAKPATAGCADTPSAKSGDCTVCIAGVGYAVPKNIRPTSEILKAFPGRTEEEMIKLTGIKERRYAGPDETATSLAATAARQALAEANLSPEAIDGIIMATILPDQPVPSMASALARELGCVKAFAFDLNAACSGWLFALETGRSLVLGGAGQRILVVTAELTSRILNPNDYETAFLLGDGAGAALLTPDAGGHRLHRLGMSGDARQFDAIQRRGGGATRPFPDPSGSDQADFYLQIDGAAVFKSAVIAFADQIEQTLRRHNLKPEDIAWIVPHQANERILRAVGKRVGIPYEKFVVTISKYGNTSAASVSMALGWAAGEGIFTSGDRIIFCSVGGGLTFAGGLLVW